jgi:hypothetical protein
MAVPGLVLDKEIRILGTSLEFCLLVVIIRIRNPLVDSKLLEVRARVNFSR